MSAQGRRSGGLGPLVGFIMLIVVGGFSYLIAPAVADWLATTELSFGALGWKILPLQLSPGWSALVVNIVVGLVLFVVIFSILTIVFFLLMKPPREELDIELSTVRGRKRRSQHRR